MADSSIELRSSEINERISASVAVIRVEGRPLKCTKVKAREGEGVGVGGRAGEGVDCGHMYAWYAHTRVYVCVCACWSFGILMAAIKRKVSMRSDSKCRQNTAKKKEKKILG